MTFNHYAQGSEKPVRPNFKQDIISELQLNSETPEQVIACVITGNIEYYRWKEDPRNVSKELLNVAMPWEDFSKLMDYEYDSGYGCQDCHNFYVWTADYLYFVEEYDGSTTVVSVPRNPPI